MRPPPRTTWHQSRRLAFCRGAPLLRCATLAPSFTHRLARHTTHTSVLSHTMNCVGCARTVRCAVNAGCSTSSSSICGWRPRSCPTPSRHARATATPPTHYVLLGCGHVSLPPRLSRASRLSPHAGRPNHCGYYCSYSDASDGRPRSRMRKPRGRIRWPQASPRSLRPPLRRSRRRSVS